MDNITLPTKFPRRVSTGKVRSVAHDPFRGLGHAFNLFSGQALYQWHAANARLAAKKVSK